MTPHYKDMLEKGQLFQDFVMMELHRIGIVLQPIQSKKYQLMKENLLGMEIKFDDRCKETGNLYFEVSEKTNADNEFFVASGIFRDDESWLYAIGDYNGIYIFSKKRLQGIYHRVKSGSQILNARLKEIPTSRGMVIPIQKALEVCERYIPFCAKNAEAKTA